MVSYHLGKKRGNTHSHIIRRIFLGRVHIGVMKFVAYESGPLDSGETRDRRKILMYVSLQLLTLEPRNCVI